ncbi:MAG: hypothetical protein R3C44_14235 [Chloroflexota bacterium]
MGDFFNDLSVWFSLREQTFENIGTDEDLTGQAFLVVLLVALAGAISGTFWRPFWGLVRWHSIPRWALRKWLMESSLFRLPSVNPVSVFLTRFIASSCPGCYGRW